MNPTDLSVMALGGATVLYAIAMVAYAIRLARVADEKVAARAAAAVPVGAGGPATPSTSGGEAPAASSRGARSAKAAGIARSSTLVGAVLHGVGLAARGIDAGHVPWSNMYEYTISGSFFAVVAFLVLQRRRDVAYLGAGVTGMATISLGLALTVLYKDVDTLPPALQSYWLIIHVSIATIVTGIFAVSFVVSALQLMRDSRDGGSRWTGDRMRWLDAVPAASSLEALSFRLNAVGFVLWTFTVMAGAIWAEHAWGRYWGWDPKEVWSFVIWVLYAAYLHARTTQGWAGRRSAWLAIAGFTALIMNFTVVNLFFQGLHTYAGS
ncbi:c-type cytochrome biogenesis protein CcsB [Demequina sp. SYSU T00192]|uniref:C-type cytochrome biogenesis protein CcsB n=1 Tax=Demequina litoralis TaxID=3051660 RepID=A0ABT8G8M0_9MICO|nr:c-type cytochrome biogenesis protein CcsB [Demequina sp. SYSU T00192]MDN4475342.1 c-type cytochrome biogenesis protein CcsB [Demequina sp. SYSU T00192]